MYVVVTVIGTQMDKVTMRMEARSRASVILTATVYRCDPAVLCCGCSAAGVGVQKELDAASADVQTIAARR